MVTYKKRLDFLTSEEGLKAAETLNLMVQDATYITEPSFSANTEMYTDNQIPFVEKHLTYLRDHPSTNPDHYLSNLKLMTRVRR